MAEFFGFEIKRKEKELGAVTPPATDDGTYDISGGGFYSTILDTDGRSRTEDDLIRRYRDIAIQPECDSAIEDIVSEAIASDERDMCVSIALDNLQVSATIKKRIKEEFERILQLLDFNNKAHDIFRRWYVDGRIFYHKVIDTQNPRKGIQQLRYIDPRKIKKVREVETNRKGQVDVVKKFKEFYIYNQHGHQVNNTSTGVKLTFDSIAYCPSGLIDMHKGTVLSYLNKAIKPVNQLRMIEDSVVIYRISRAPERRIFYIDVGNLPKIKAEQYLKDVMNRYRNKLVYDASTGEIRDDRNHMSMLEDFWLPRREGGRGTEITTLPGGANLGEIEDIKYFQKKLYRSLNVPVSRLTEESPGTIVGMGRSTEVTRDELKFTKFVQRLRKRFTALFLDILRTQLLLKGVMNDEDWYNIKQHIQFDFLKDGHFAELKHAELLEGRLNTLDRIQSYIGTFYSKEYVQKYVLRLTDAEISTMSDEIKKETGEGDVTVPDESDGVTRYPQTGGGDQVDFNSMNNGEGDEE